MAGSQITVGESMVETKTSAKVRGDALRREMSDGGIIGARTEARSPRRAAAAAEADRPASPLPPPPPPPRANPGTPSPGASAWQ